MRVDTPVANSGGQGDFEPSRCTFVHRMPAAQAAPAVAGTGTAARAGPDCRVITQGKVCADPEKPCRRIQAERAVVRIAKPFAFDRGRDKSQPFYAVILMSGPLCGVADRERARAQQLFPRAKVFLHRHMCEDFGDKVTYSNVNAKSGFVAVYGGETEADAQKMLAQARAAGLPGGANPPTHGSDRHVSDSNDAEAGTFLLTDYCGRYPWSWSLSEVTEDALRDLLAVSRRLALEKSRR